MRLSYLSNIIDYSRPRATKPSFSTSTNPPKMYHSIHLGLDQHQWERYARIWTHELRRLYRESKPPHKNHCRTAVSGVRFAAIDASPAMAGNLHSVSASQTQRRKQQSKGRKRENQIPFILHELHRQSELPVYEWRVPAFPQLEQFGPQKNVLKNGETDLRVDWAEVRANIPGSEVEPHPKYGDNEPGPRSVAPFPQRTLVEPYVFGKHQKVIIQTGLQKGIIPKTNWRHIFRRPSLIRKIYKSNLWIIKIGPSWRCQLEGKNRRGSNFEGAELLDSLLGS